MNILTQLGMRIRYLRKLKGMSQLDLALESNINKNYISDLERGSRNPSLLILERICKALEIDYQLYLRGYNLLNSNI